MPARVDQRGDAPRPIDFYFPELPRTDGGMLGNKQRRDDSGGADGGGGGRRQTCRNTRKSLSWLLLIDGLLTERFEL